MKYISGITKLKDGDKIYILRDNGERHSTSCNPYTVYNAVEDGNELNWSQNPGKKRMSRWPLKNIEVVEEQSIKVDPYTFEQCYEIY